MSLRNRILAWEATPLHPGAWLASLVAVALLRNALEGLLEADHQWTVRVALGPGLTDLLHVTLAWTCVVLLASLGLAWARRAPVLQVSRVVLRAFPLILLVPLADGLLGQPGRIQYQYDFQRFFASYRQLLLPWRSVGYVTAGVRLEILLGALLAGGYAALAGQGRRLWRVLAAGLLVYHLPFLLGYLPALWAAAFGQTAESLARRSALGVNAAEASLIWYLPIAIPAALAWVRATSPGAWAALKDCLRPSRLVVYLLLLNGGFLAATREGLVDWDWLNPYDGAELLLANLAVVSAFAAQAALNDLFDRAIDRRSNPDRPLASGRVPPATYGWLAGLGSGLAVLIALVVDPVAVYPMLAILALGWVYSAPPFRLRRFLALGHLVLAGIGMGSYLLGATLVHGNLAFRQCDRPLLGLIGALFFAGSHFKDLKDTAGDREAGVTTLATWLGERRAYWAAGSLVMAVAAAGVLTGILPKTPWTWAALGIFELSWLILRDGERMLRALAATLGILLAGAFLG